MFEEVIHGTKTKDEGDPRKRLEDQTNCYEKMIICYLIVLYNLYS